MRSSSGDVVYVQSADGTSIGLHRSGRGPSLVVVPGAGADAAAFGLVAPLLANDFTVYRMDRRGRGASGDGPEYAYEREIEDVIAAVEGVPAPVYLYGHSFGGGLAFEAATRLSLVAALVIYEGGVKTFPLRLTPDEVIDELQALVDAGRNEDMLVRFMQSAARVSETELALLRRQDAWAGRVAAAHTIPRELRALNDRDPDPDFFDRLSTPVLFVLGGATTGMRREMFLAMAAKTGNCRLVELPGQAHIAHQGAPQLLADAVRGVLAFAPVDA